MMRRFGLRVGAWALAGAVMAMLAAACGAASHTTSQSTGSGQQISTMSLIKAGRALDRGVLTYSKLAILQVGQTTSFDVEVTDVGKGAGRSGFAPESRGRLVAPHDLPAGRIVSVQSICSEGLTCTPRSSATRQTIAGPGRSATWRWEVTARSPGEARIVLTATAYGRKSKIVLDKTSVMLQVKVQSTPLYVLQTGFDTKKGAVVFLASGMLAVAGTLGAVLGLLRKRRGNAAAETPPRADPSGAQTEPLRAPIGRSLPMGLPAARPTPGWKALLWLLPADIAFGGLAVRVVRDAAPTSPAFAIIIATAVVVAPPIYFLPVIIAYTRPAPDRASVAIINVFLGWTYVGWVVALALAARERRPASVVAPGPESGHSKYPRQRDPARRGEPDVSPAGRAALSERGSR
jgi:Superinfection immunity protein